MRKRVIVPFVDGQCTDVLLWPVEREALDNLAIAALLGRRVRTSGAYAPRAVVDRLRRGQTVKLTWLKGWHRDMSTGEFLRFAIRRFGIDEQFVGKAVAMVDDRWLTGDATDACGVLDARFLQAAWLLSVKCETDRADHARHSELDRRICQLMLGPRELDVAEQIMDALWPPSPEADQRISERTLAALRNKPA